MKHNWVNVGHYGLTASKLQEQLAVDPIGIFPTFRVDICVEVRVEHCKLGGKVN